MGSSSQVVQVGFELKENGVLSITCNNCGASWSVVATNKSGVVCSDVAHNGAWEIIKAHSGYCGVAEENN